MPPSNQERWWQWDALLSCSQPNELYAAELSKELQSHGLDVFFFTDPARGTYGLPDWQAKWSKNASLSRHLIVIAGGGPISTSQNHEFGQYLETSKGTLYINYVHPNARTAWAPLLDTKAAEGRVLAKLGYEKLSDTLKDDWAANATWSPPGAGAIQDASDIRHTRDCMEQTAHRIARSFREGLHYSLWPQVTFVACLTMTEGECSDLLRRTNTSPLFDKLSQDKQQAFLDILANCAPCYGSTRGHWRWPESNTTPHSGQRSMVDVLRKICGGLTPKFFSTLRLRDISDDVFNIKDQPPEVLYSHFDSLATRGRVIFVVDRLSLLHGTVFDTFENISHITYRSHIDDPKGAFWWLFCTPSSLDDCADHRHFMDNALAHKHLKHFAESFLLSPTPFVEPELWSVRQLTRWLHTVFAPIVSSSPHASQRKGVSHLNIGKPSAPPSMTDWSTS